MKRMISCSALLFVLGTVATGFAQDSGADLYTTNCAPCHGATGNADTPAGKKFKAKSFNTEDALKKNDVELVAFTKAGKGDMPPWADVLTDDQIKQVITYIRAFKK